LKKISNFVFIVDAILKKRHLVEVRHVTLLHSNTHRIP